AEVRVDLLIGVEQPHPALAVEVADRAAQAVDRLAQLLRLLGPPGPRFVEFGKLAFGYQINRADPLALSGQALERGRLLVGGADVRGAEAELFGQALRHALELLDAGLGELGAALALGVGASQRTGPALARVGELLAGGIDLAGDLGQRPLRLLLGRRRLTDPDLAFAVGALELGDLAVELGRLTFELGALRALLLLPLPGLGQAALGVALAALPLRLIAAGGAVSLAVRRRLACAGRGLRALVGDRRGGRRRRRSRTLDILLESRRIGQRRKRALGSADRGTGRRSCWRWSSSARCDSTRSSAAVAASPARAASRASRSAASAACRACSARARHESISASAESRSAIAPATVSWRPGRSRASSARRLARSSRSAVAAPAPSATNPSQRRRRPSRVTSRWPTASGSPPSSSTTATWRSRRFSSAGDWA